MQTALTKFEKWGKGQDFSAIKSFALLRHLHHDWPKWLSFMRQNDEKGIIHKMFSLFTVYLSIFFSRDRKNG